MSAARMMRSGFPEIETMFRITIAALAATVLMTATSVHAADGNGVAGIDTTTATVDASTATMAGDVDWSLAPVKFGRESRGALLPSLYVSLAALNAFDAYSTTKGLSLGAAEANPMMRGVANRPAMLWAVKGGVTAGSVYIAERLWKNNNKVGAVVVMVATNSMMATIAARNSSVIRSQR
jgi:hypothetical protein